MSATIGVDFLRKTTDPKIASAVRALHALREAGVGEVPKEICETLGLGSGYHDVNEVLNEGDDSLYCVGQTYVGASVVELPGVEPLNYEGHPPTGPCDYPTKLKIDLDHLPDDVRVIIVSLG